MSSFSKNENSQAMQNLFSAYGDDDIDADESLQMEMVFTDDEELRDHSGTPTKSNPRKDFSENASPENPPNQEQKEGQRPVESSPKKAKLTQNITATRLVSYGPDDQDGEEEEDDQNKEDEDATENDIFNQFKSVSDVTSDSRVPMSPEQNYSSSNSVEHSFSEDDVQIPPEPSGNCSIRVQTKIEKLYKDMLHSGKDMNAVIQRRKEFRNPSIYDKLIEYCSIDEKGTNYPPELFNPTIWGEDSTYEVLAQIQHTEMEKRTKKDKAMVERLQGTKKSQPINSSSPSADHKHKSKWDSLSNSNSAVSVKTK